MPIEVGIPLLIVCGALMVYAMIKISFGKPKATVKWEADVEKYKSIIEQLPEQLVVKLFYAIYNTGMSMGLPSRDLPDELTKVVGAATSVRNAKSFGSISNGQDTNINSLINQFENQMETLIPVGKKALNQSIDGGGLGFGLITNNAADAALYQAMDYHDRVKQYKRMNYTVNQMVDKEVVVLMDSIKRELS